jgi:tight adherence protein B
MSLLLIVLLLATLTLGGFLLYRDTQLKLVDRQIGLMLPAQITVSAPLSLRLQNLEADDGRLLRILRMLRLLLRYTPNSPNQLWFALIGLVAAAGSVAVSSLLLPLWLALTGGFAIWFLVVRGLFGRQQFQYANRLVRQMPDTLQIIISAARAGLPVAEAFRAVIREMPNPGQEQFTWVVNDMALGKTIDDALLSVFHRTQVPEYAMFSITMAVQGKAGGRLAETLQTLADTVRQRISLAGRAKALAGEATLSARVLSCLPLVAGIISYIERSDTMDTLFYDPRGRFLFAIGVISLSLGILTMRRMIRKGTTV